MAQIELWNAVWNVWDLGFLPSSLVFHYRTISKGPEGKTNSAEPMNPSVWIVTSENFLLIYKHGSECEQCP